MTSGEPAGVPTDGRTPPLAAPGAGDLLWQRLEEQLTWYDQAAHRSRSRYQALKVVALLAGAAVTVLAAISAPPAITATVAATIVVVEGAQQVFQFHANWINYRVTAETLRQHALLYAAALPPYADPETRRVQLAQALHDATAAERTTWTSTMRQAPGTGAVARDRGPAPS